MRKQQHWTGPILQLHCSSTCNRHSHFIVWFHSSAKTQISLGEIGIKEKEIRERVYVLCNKTVITCIYMLAVSNQMLPKLPKCIKSQQNTCTVSCPPFNWNFHTSWLFSRSRKPWTPCSHHMVSTELMDLQHRNSDFYGGAIECLKV